MIVADTNLAAHLFLDAGWTEQARRIQERDPEWRLPPFWRTEYLNVLWRFASGGILGHGEALRAWRAGVEYMSEGEVDVDGETVLETAIRYSVTAYDAHFVVLAESLGVPLVTADRKLVRACKGVAISYGTFLRRNRSR